MFATNTYGFLAWHIKNQSLDCTSKSPIGGGQDYRGVC
jgi:hypothetical protein